jgi:hypothetical protein
MHEILTAHVNDQLEPYEVPPDDVLAGEPLARSKLLLHVLGDMTGAMSGICSANPARC